ncbi:hypothetical protein [Nonomuraea sp. NPDC003201]
MKTVLREVTEETGLIEVAVVGRIAVDHRPREDNGRPRQRTFFLLTADPGSADAWHHRVHGDGVDAGMEFACRFVPVPLVEVLADAQDAWLSRVDGRGGKAVSSS